MPEITPYRYTVTAGWNDAPHLSEEMKKRELSACPPHLRDARSKGIPRIGAGAIYPIDEKEISVAPFEIPPYWPRAYAMDVGWNCTAASWGAWDRDSDTLYVYSTYKKGQELPLIHADAIKGRGKWIPGVIDPAARGRSQQDGSALFQEYLKFGLNISPANNRITGPESGIYVVWQRLSTGRLKVFVHCNDFFDEYRIYRRDDNGKIVKEHDHLMDCMRYLVVSGMSRATTEAIACNDPEDSKERYSGRSAVGGY